MTVKINESLLKDIKGVRRLTERQVLDRCNSICGCDGKYDCQCVSVLNRAIGELWYEHNTKERRVA